MLSLPQGKGQQDFTEFSREGCWKNLAQTLDSSLSLVARPKIVPFLLFSLLTFKCGHFLTQDSTLDCSDLSEVNTISRSLCNSLPSLLSGTVA